jgi:hypothetical protein
MILFSATGLTKLGNQIITIIRKRTLAGLDVNLKKFKPYSTKWFNMPSGSATKKAKEALLRQDNLMYFRTKKGKLWISVNGYLNFKKANFGGNYDGKVNLSFTGNMLNGLSVLQVGNNEIIIGFKRQEEAEKAIWNRNSGREFLGLHIREIDKLNVKVLND